jgi:F-type H+-transporting ATPase subunit epsilon
MNLKILLPFRVFTEVRNVRRVVAETTQGSFGMLPHRLDCVAVLEAGILLYETAAGEEIYVAVDEGVLVKSGAEVRVSVRHAISGMPLGSLREAVTQEFLTLDEGERQLRTVLAKLENGFVRRFAEFQHG